MSKINSIEIKQSEENLLNDLINNKIQVGLTEFNRNKIEIGVLPSNYEKVGNFELDVLAIERNSGNIVMLDHDQLSFKMGIIAENLEKFVSALVPIENYFERIKVDDSLYEDIESIKIVTKHASEIAGNIEYSWFYDMTFGV